MSSIYNSDRKIEQFFLGSQEITEMFLGNELVFSKITNNLFYKLHEFVGSLIVQNTIEAPVKSAILKGNTKYRDIDTGDILNAFDETKNLELVSVKMPVLTTTGKNLYNKSPFKGYVDSSNGKFVMNNSTTRKISDYVEVKPNTMYKVSGCTMTAMWGYDKDKNPISAINIYVDITTTNNMRFIAFSINSELEHSNIQIEEGTVATSYEPHKSNILTVNEDVTLRSNGDVYDELNLLTGRLTQRIDENNEVLAQAVVKTVDLRDNVVYSYDEVTHYDGSSESGSLVPTLAVKVPTNVNAVISSQRATIQEQTEQINTLEKENTLLTEQNEKQDVDIALNQDAINFMLFEVMGLSNDDANKLNPMAIYFANQILKGKLTYTQVIGKYPQFKDDIDSCLLAEGRSDLIVKID